MLCAVSGPNTFLRDIVLSTIRNDFSGQALVSLVGMAVLLLSLHWVVGVIVLLAAIPGVSVAEMPRNRRDAYCCGAGGMIYPVDPALSRKVTDRRAAESPSDSSKMSRLRSCRSAARGSL